MGVEEEPNSLFETAVFANGLQAAQRAGAGAVSKLCKTVDHIVKPQSGETQNELRVFL